MAAASNVMKLTDLPGVRQVIVLVAIAGAVAGGIALYLWSQQPAWTPLYGNLADKDASQVAEALRGAGIEFRLDPSGGVSVPQEKLYDARLKLAGAGLPNGSDSAFDSMGQEGFGVSSLVENARYQHALETELTRTIAAIRSVQSARVHLALPKASAFAREQPAASASVLVQLYPGRMLDAAQVSSIVHLVAASVPELKPDNVTVIDQMGRLLTGANDGGEAALSATQYELRRRLEQDYVKRIQDLLLPMTGPGHVSAQVSADLDFTETEQASETYAADPAKVRSEQVSSQTSGAANSGPTGVPGAASNQPTPAATQPIGASAAAATATPATAGPGATTPAGATTTNTTTAAGQQSHSETRNYELDKTLTHVRQPSGRVQRLSVAVLVDNLPQPAEKGAKPTFAPLTDAQLEQVRGLVREAVGFDEKRGDTLSVMNAQFQRETVPAVPALPIWQRPDVLDWARRGLGGLLVLIIAFAVLRPALKELTTIKPAPALTASVVAEERPALGGGGGNAAALQYEEKLALARGAVAQDAKKVAQVVRTWVGTDG